jgi:hypothetical protein
LVIDFQYGFRSNQVELRLDGQTMFSGRLTTDDRVGLAKTIHLPLVPGKATLRALVVVDGSSQPAFDIRLARGRYVGFFKNLDDGKIGMEQSREPFLYD